MSSFPEYVNEHLVPIKIVPKRSSDFMVSLGRLLDWATKLGMTNITKEQFLTQYTTTIGDTIYSDELTMQSAPSPLLIHEINHRLQFLNRRMPFEYVIYRESRAYYESESIQAAMVCFPDLPRHELTLENAARQAEHLVRYGIPLQMAVAAVYDRILEIKRDKIPVRPRWMRDALNEWRLTG